LAVGLSARAGGQVDRMNAAEGWQDRVSGRIGWLVMGQKNCPKCL